MVLELTIQSTHQALNPITICQTMLFAPIKESLLSKGLLLVKQCILGFLFFVVKNCIAPTKSAVTIAIRQAIFAYENGEPALQGVIGHKTACFGYFCTSPLRSTTDSGLCLELLMSTSCEEDVILEISR